MDILSSFPFTGLLGGTRGALTKVPDCPSSCISNSFSTQESFGDRTAELIGGLTYYKGWRFAPAHVRECSHARAAPQEKPNCLLLIKMLPIFLTTSAACWCAAPLRHAHAQDLSPRQAHDLFVAYLHQQKRAIPSEESKKFLDKAIASPEERPRLVDSVRPRSMLL
jgi:hypothetical protein